MLKNYFNTNIRSTFEYAYNISTGLHFSFINLFILYFVFVFGIIKLIPGTETFCDMAQIKLGQIAFVIGVKEK